MILCADHVPVWPLWAGQTHQVFYDECFQMRCVNCGAGHARPWLLDAIVEDWDEHPGEEADA